MNFSDFNKGPEQIIKNNITYTDWIPGIEGNNVILEKNNIKTNRDYRKYMVKNADKIITYNQLEACNNTSFCSETYNKEDQSSTPYLFDIRDNNDIPNGYETSDLKEKYIANYNINNNVKIPVIKKQ